MKGVISEYCKVCKLFDECVKSKTCSCIDFVTDVDITIKIKRKYI